MTTAQESTFAILVSLSVVSEIEFFDSDGVLVALRPNGVDRVFISPNGESQIEVPGVGLIDVVLP